MGYYDTNTFIDDCTTIRRRSPMVQCMTNFVSALYVGNALVSIGASPFACLTPQEVEEVSNNADSLFINTATINGDNLKAMKMAARIFHSLRKPWILAPAAFEMTGYRKKVVLDFINDSFPTAIRGTASDICSLAASVGCEPVPCSGLGEEEKRMVRIGMASANRKMIPLKDIVGYAVSLARATGSIVFFSEGAHFITDGLQLGCIENGSPAVRFLTGFETTSTAFASAFLAIDKDPFIAVMNGCALTGVSVEVATNPQVLRPVGKLVKGLDAPEWMQGPFESVLMFTYRSFFAPDFARMVREKTLKVI